MKVIAGVDIGGTNTVAGIIDQNGSCVVTCRFPTTEAHTADQFVLRLAQTIQGLCGDLAGDVELCGIGIAAPAANYRTGIIQNSANLRWRTVEIVEMMRHHIDLPVAVTNDANAAALGEMMYGAARGMRNFVAVTLGTGLGSGIVVDGQIVSGENGVAGELGHITVVPGGRVCGCGRRGCAETYVSAPGIRRTVSDLLAREIHETELRDISYVRLTAEKICELATHGDVIAREAFEITGRYLGQLLSNMAALFDPQAIVLSGGLMNAGDLLLCPTRRSFDENLLGPDGRTVSMLKSQLNNGEAAILGAACLVAGLPAGDSRTVGHAEERSP